MSIENNQDHSEEFFDLWDESRERQTREAFLESEVPVPEHIHEFGEAAVDLFTESYKEVRKANVEQGYSSEVASNNAHVSAMVSTHSRFC